MVKQSKILSLCPLSENREKMEFLRLRITKTEGVNLDDLVRNRRLIKAGELKVKSSMRPGEKQFDPFEAFAFLTDGPSKILRPKYPELNITILFFRISRPSIPVEDPKAW